MKWARFGALIFVAAVASTGCTIVTQPASCGGSVPDDCGGYCTNVTNDPHNCGGCGLSCAPGDSCQGGQCLTGGGPTCTNDGDPCTADANCCSNLCDVTNTCASPAGGCVEDNAPCSNDAECCSGLCGTDGYCALSVCAPEGASCATDNDCCNPLYCDNGGCSTCVSSANPCNVDADCCSGVCDASVCN